MSRKAIIQNFGSPTISFIESLSEISKVEVDAFAPTGKRTVGRTAQAIGQLRESAHTEAFAIGYAEGFAAGKADGLLAVEQEYREQIDAFTEVLQSKTDQVVFAMRDWVERGEQQLAELAVGIAAEILAQEIQLSHDTISSLVKQTLSEVRLAETARIRINPFDHVSLESHRSELLAASSQLRQIEIVNDASIVGGCLIESDSGTIDSTIRTRIELAQSALREAA